MNRLNMTRHALAKRLAIIGEGCMVVRTMGDDELCKQWANAYQQCMEQYAAVCAVRNAIRRGYKV